MRRFFSLVGLLIALSSTLCAQGAEWIRANYTKHEFMVPMRDGATIEPCYVQMSKPA